MNTMRHTDGNTFQRIYDVVKRIPAGHVATYGMVTTLAGNPKMSRVVGYALHVNPDPGTIPCFRVVNRFGECSGSFAFGGKGAQEALLLEDGVLFLPDGRVDLKSCLWQPDTEG
ncbi:MAG: MGMT family protein [Oscillospiraceae bacterium]|nr:MGMT family protein [Oscillospiraceae bacterium]